MTTVLEKCGITIEIVKFFKAKGLVVKAGIAPFPKFMQSPGKNWFSSITDRFAPPLSPSEKEAMIQDPKILTSKIIEGVKLLSELSGLLNETVVECGKKLRKEEAAGALLAINHIFISCLHYNYLKFDRHLEYHDYPESPVGYYWKKFDTLCEKAAKKIPEKERERWKNDKILQVLGGHTAFSKTSEYASICEDVKSKLILNGISMTDAKSAESRIRETYPSLHEQSLVYANHFHKDIVDFIGDCISIRKGILNKRSKSAYEISQHAIQEVKSNLTNKEGEKFDKIRDTLFQFLSTQEEEGLIFFGVTPYGDSHIVDAPFGAIAALRSILNGNKNFVRQQYEKVIESLLEKEDPPSRMIACTRLASDLENSLIKPIQTILNEELDRWR